MIETSVFTLSDLAVAGRKTIAPSCYGFQIRPDPRNRGTYPLKLHLYGVRGGQGDLMVCAPDWHKVSVARIEVEALQANDPGQWFLQWATDPRAGVIPSAPPPVPADFPAAMGGGGSVTQVNTAPPQLFTEVQALTRAAPVAAGLGQAINGASVFQAWLDAGANTITGGSVDIWRFDSTSGTWQPYLVGVQLALNPGGAPQSRAGIPLDSFLLRGAGDRWLVATNGVLLSAGATVTVNMRVQ